MFNLSFLTRFLSAGAVLATTLTLVPSAYGFDPVDVSNFLDGSCTGCDISGADLSQEDIVPIEFVDVNATDTNFFLAAWSGLFGQETVVDIDFTRANFVFSEITDSLFESSIFVDTNFTSAFLDFVIFQNSIFTNAIFDDAFLAGVEFINSINAPASVSSTFTPQNTGTDLTGTSFIGAEILDSSFENADFADADLSGASFRNVNLRGANVNQQQLNSLAFFSGTLPDGTVVTVPEPSMILGLFLFGGLGLVRRKG
jgi:uncharacterized protein YjbI with pentapeptide repeats